MRLLTATGADALPDLDAATATRRAAVATPATGDAGQPDRIDGGPDGARSTVLCPAAAVVVDHVPTARARTAVRRTGSRLVTRARRPRREPRS
ncbi:hypothetical protein [Nonomuraea indica]|uniref:Uncharacterized protein n=1 Tax=Nonomuraea indica TaxID=1581193 RepID=A0ABW8A7J5_9ACTN